MTLQELSDCALKGQWFSASYRGPLHSYAKRYAAALGRTPETCEPAAYHLPDAQVHEIMIQAADPELHPRSVQAGINVVLKLLHRAVEEGCLPPWKAPLDRLHRMGGIRSYRALLHRTDAPANTPYGLRQWPEALAYETAMYDHWCGLDVARGRPVKIRKGLAASTMMQQIVGGIAAYAVDGRGLDKESLTLEQLCQPALLEDYAWWWIQRRGRSTSTILKNLSTMKTIVRYWYRDEPAARGIIDVMKRIKSEAPPQRTLDKEARELSLEELHRLAQSLYPLNEIRLKRLHRLQVIKRYLNDPTTYPLKPGYGSGISHLTTWAGLSLIIEILIHRPLRIGNLAKLEFRHLRAQPQGGYEIIIPKTEMKNGKFMRRAEWRERFPARLLPQLHEWLTIWRPHLLKPGQESPYVFLNRSGRPYTTGVLSQNIRLLSLRLTQERPAGPVIWFPHAIRTTWTKEMLFAGLNPYIVQRIIGDSFKVIDQHYGGHQERPTSAFARQLAKEIGEGVD